MDLKAELMNSSPSSSTTFRTWLTQVVQPLVETQIKRTLNDCEFRDRQWYPISTGGKRLRPALIFLAGELCSCDRGPLIDSAAGVELLHVSSLIHDDIIDNDRTRHNEPTYWAKYGHNEAVNIGNMMAYHGIALIPSKGQTLAATAAREMTIGQQQEFDFEDRQDVTEEAYLDMVQKKSGALFDLCLELPQTLSGTDLDISGYSALWPAYQIRDDLLDFEASKGRTAIGSDVRAGKRTLMVIHADDDHVYDILDKSPEETTNEDVAIVQTIFEERGSFEYARQCMHTYATEALAALESLPDSSQRQRLIALGQYCTIRDH